jgi:lipopolysaccharide export system protein LptA
MNAWINALLDRCTGAAVAMVLLAAAATGATAQPNSNKGVPNALQGFSQNRDQPVNIEAASLEVRDKDRVATFTGNVRVVQGDTTMRCKTLVVYYEEQGTAAGGPRTGANMPGGAQRINRLEAKGGVTVTQKDQTATGESGLFDMRANTIMLTGKVVVSQGENVLRGERLVVDLTTGVSRVDAGKSHGPVRMLIQQKDGATPGPGIPKLGPR